MESLILVLAEQGHWFVAFLGACAVLFYERRSRETNAKFRAMLEAHDAKNDTDFRRLDDKIDALKSEIHEIGKSVARIDGHLNGRHKEPD